MMLSSPRLILSAVIATVALSGATSAFADTVTLDFKGSAASPGATVSVQTQTGSFWGWPIYSDFHGSAGAMNFKVTGVSDSADGHTNPFSVGSSIITFCINPTSALSDPDTYTVDETPFSDNNASLLTELYAAHYNDAMTSGTNAAAFQLAMWELVVDAPNSGSYSFNNGLSSGKFQNDGTSSGIVSLANTWLGDFQVKGADTSGWTLYELDAGSRGQSQIFGTYTAPVPGGSSVTSPPAVPLPAAAPAGMLLMAGIAAFRKRRKAC